MDPFSVALAPFWFLSIGAIALFTFLAVASWSGARTAEREAYYKNDMMKKLAESPEGGVSALAYLREEQREAVRRHKQGLEMGGLISAAVGIGILIFLRALIHGAPIYLVGVIPLLIGIALFGYARFGMKEEPAVNAISDRSISR